MLSLSRSRRSRASVLVPAGALALLMALAWSAPAGATGASTAHVPMISRGGLAVAVPAPGTGVVASELTASGAVRELRVETTLDGRVVVVTQPDAASVVGASTGAGTGAGAGAGSGAGSPVSPTGSPPACSDRAHTVFDSWWHSTMHWSFKSASKPSNMTAATAETQLKRAVANITSEHNDCGRPDRVSAKSHYDGRTTRGTGIGSDASCISPDGHNTVAFGDLPTSFVGLTCWWYSGNTTYEADMQLNKHDYDWAVKPSSCFNAFIIQDVATHEFGHVFGLGHANPQDAHANLTMSPAIYPCDASDETLGLGDMLGLEVHY